MKARFVKTENPALFKMKTTTVRLPEYSKYGEVHFELNGEPCKLEVYQSNGKESYEGGRYLDFRKPSSQQVIVDFNLSYNPYCAYNPNYSWPIPPEVNYLPLAIKAGEMKFKDGH